LFNKNKEETVLHAGKDIVINVWDGTNFITGGIEPWPFQLLVEKVIFPRSIFKEQTKSLGEKL